MLVRFDVLCYDIHCHLAEIQVCADARRRRDAGCRQNIFDQHLCERPWFHIVVFEIWRSIDEYLVDRVDVDIIAGYIVQIQFIDFCADLDIARHARRRNDIADCFGRGAGEFAQDVRLPFQPPAAVCLAALPVDRAYLLDHFKQPRSARNAEGFERRRHGKADRFVAAALVGNDKVGRERIQPAVHTFHRSVE